MQGRSCVGLLTIYLLVWPARPLIAQSARFSPSPDSGGRVSHSLPAPVRGPLVGVPERFPLGESVLTTLTRTAGMIFSGTVTTVSRNRTAANQALQTVAITFRVENAIRGATSGESVTITQWIGLWSSGQRYRVGERVLLFLYPPSKLGLTSCVGASLGRFGVDAAGRVLLSSQQLSAFLKDPALGGKSRLRFSDFALAVRQASEEE